MQEARKNLRTVTADLHGKLQSIAYCHGSENRYFDLDMLRVLKREFGAQVHVYCHFYEQKSFYEKALAERDIDSLTIVDHLYKIRPIAPQERERIVAKARENERALGVTYNRLIMGQRTFGHAFSLGGFYHPRAAFAEEADYYQTLDVYNRTIAVWNEAVERHRISLVINPTLQLSYVADSHKIPMRRYRMTGQDNLHFWVSNRYDQSGELDRAMAEMPDQPPVEIKGTYGSNSVIMARIKRDISLHRCIFLAIRQAGRRLYWHLRRYQKARSYMTRDVSRFYFRRRQQMLILRRLAKTQLSDLAGRRFVFFPLHEEPETVLTIGAPEVTSQLAVIAAIARDLPAGVVLAVKETYFGVGRRPTEFYRQIADFKNVVMLDVMEPGLEVGRQAAAVITIRGTVGQEAGILGRPVIYLGHHSTYRAIPHARYSNVDLGLKDALAWALDENFDFERARIDGARFHASLHAVSVDMRGFNRLRPDIYDADLPAAAVDALARSLICESGASTKVRKQDIALRTTS